MPQLAPLSWLGLYMFFWALLLALCMSAWWWGAPRLSSPSVKMNASSHWTWC